MEEKKKSGKGLLLFLLIVCIAIILGLVYYVSNLQELNNEQIVSLQTENRDLKTENEEYKSKIDSITNVLNIDNETKETIETEETEKTKNTKTVKENEFEDIVLEGLYTIPTPSDFGGYTFAKDGKVYSGGNVSSTEGNYKTIGKNIIEVHFTKIEGWDPSKQQEADGSFEIDRKEIGIIDEKGHIHFISNMNEEYENITIVYPEEEAMEIINNYYN